MTDKNTEMSLDEVLSSIKKMVIDDEPPVLELTNMIASDGSIVEIKKNECDGKNSDISSFLKMIQENTESESHSRSAKGKKSAAKERCQVEKDVDVSIVTNGSTTSEHAPGMVYPGENQRHAREKDAILSGLVREMLQQWMNNHLPAIVSKSVENEIKKLLGRSH